MSAMRLFLRGSCSVRRLQVTTSQHLRGDTVTVSKLNRPMHRTHRRLLAPPIANRYFSSRQSNVKSESNDASSFAKYTAVAVAGCLTVGWALMYSMSQNPRGDKFEMPEGLEGEWLTLDGTQRVGISRHSLAVRFERGQVAPSDANLDLFQREALLDTTGSLEIKCGAGNQLKMFAVTKLAGRGNLGKTWEVRVDEAPIFGADNRWHMTLDGVKFIRHTAEEENGK